MTNEHILAEKQALIEERNSLPRGTIIRRIIRGVPRFYHQWREGGRTKSRYLSKEGLLSLRVKIERRFEIDRLLNARAKSSRIGSAVILRAHQFNMHLAALPLDFSDDAIRRDALNKATSSSATRARLIVGAPSVGKTTFLRFILSRLTNNEREKATLIILTEADSFDDVKSDIEKLYLSGVRYFFIDNLSRVKFSSALITFICDYLLPLQTRVYLAGNVNKDERCETIYLTHHPSSALLKEAFSSIEETREFLAPYATFLKAFVANTRAMLLDEDTNINAGELNDFTVPYREEPISKTKKSSTRFVCRYPQLRRVIGQAIISEIINGEAFFNHGANERKRARDTLLSALENLILEEQILLRFSTDEIVCLLFTKEERAFVRVREKELTCQLYKVFNTEKRSEEMLIDLINPRRLDVIEHRFGLITSREILYRGRTARHASGIIFRSI